MDMKNRVRIMSSAQIDSTPTFQMWHCSGLAEQVMTYVILFTLVQAEKLCA
jgi:hypothetical protein